MSTLLIATLLVTFIVSTIYYISQRKFNYWKKKKVPHLKPKPFFGNYGSLLLLNEMEGLVAQKICQQFPNEPYVGVYLGTEPVLIVKDPELIKIIATKDFYYFNSRIIMDHIHKERVTGHSLVTSFGDRWKVTRQHMTPLFTSSKMRNMFHLIEKCTYDFEDMLDRENKISEVHEMRALVARYTMDCIGSCGFGVNTKTMVEDVRDNPFHAIGQKIFEVSKARKYALIGRSVWPSIFYGLGFQVFPEKIGKFFYKLITDVFEERKYTPTTRNDFVDLIMDWTKKEYLTTDSIKPSVTNTTNESQQVHIKIDKQFLVSQCVIFFAAGFETSSSALSFTVYELAKNPKAQKKAIEEVDTYLLKHNNKLGYDCVTELPYLEACLSEALRLYPAFSNISREVFEDYTLPTGLCLERGIRIHLPVFYMHRNPDYFPEPELYRPERFIGAEKEKIKPYTYLPFGEGQRKCIGKRFAMMQTLAGLVTILKKYRVEMAAGMPRTIEFSPKSQVVTSKSGINLRLVERDGWQKRMLVR